jgi:hypothetical protein
VIEEAVAEVNVGVPGALGIVYGVAVDTEESVVPEALKATTLKEYNCLPVKPVTVVGVVSFAAGLHSV